MRIIIITLLILLNSNFSSTSWDHLYLTVVNNTNTVAYCCVANYNSAQGDNCPFYYNFRVKGWYMVNPHTQITIAVLEEKDPFEQIWPCEEGTLSWHGGPIYFYAQGADGSIWSGEQQLCIDPVNPFEWILKADSKNWDQVEKCDNMVGFFEVNVVHYGNNVLNLNN